VQTQIILIHNAFTLDASFLDATILSRMSRDVWGVSGGLPLTYDYNVVYFRWLDAHFWAFWNI